jgi:hypothetical protein
MLIAEASVATERSSRYLVQLCQHRNKVGRAHSQLQAHVRMVRRPRTDQLGWGRCTLRADPAC